MPRGGRHAHVDVTVHTNNRHHHHRHHGHHGHHGHHHHHGPGAGALIGAAAVGAVAGACVASSGNNNTRSAPPPKQNTVVVVQQPGYSPQQQAYPPQQPAYQQPGYSQPGYPPQQPGYPPQQQPGSYPGYPPQQPGYPPQQPGYPPQQPGYAPQPGYPQQQGYPPQQPGYPPQPTTTVVTTGGSGTTVVVVTPTRATSLGKKWKHGNIVILTNLATNRSLKLKNGRVEGMGGQGQFAQFWVERTGPERVKLRSLASNGYLRLHPHNLDQGPGGPACEFYIVKHGKKQGKPVYSLESVQHPGCYVGFRNDGGIKSPRDTGLGNHGSFFVNVKQFAP